MADQVKTGLVVTAHPGDFVWRAGGAIALHAKKGYRVKIVCLSFGERGESQFAWKEAGATLEKVKAGRKRRGRARRRDPRRRDRVLRCRRLSAAAHARACSTAWSTSIARSIRPSCSPTRWKTPTISTIRTPRISRRRRASSRRPWATSRSAKYTYSAPPVFLFEPHQPEQCNFKPKVILNIDEVWETKHKAFEVLAAQKHLWEYYDARGAQSRRAGRPQHRQADDLWRGLSAPVPAGAGGAGMKPVVVRNIKRADANAVGDPERARRLHRA